MLRKRLIQRMICRIEEDGLNLNIMGNIKAFWSFFISDWKNWIVIVVGIILLLSGLIIDVISEDSMVASYLITFGYGFSFYGIFFGLIYSLLKYENQSNHMLVTERYPRYRFNISGLIVALIVAAILFATLFFLK